MISLPAECGNHTINIYSIKSDDFNLLTLKNAPSYLLSWPVKAKTINITEKCSLPENTTIGNVSLKDMVKEIEKGFSLDIDKQS